MHAGDQAIAVEYLEPQVPPSAVFNGNTKFLPDKSPGSDVQKKAFERAVCLRDEAVGDMSSGRFSRPRGAVLLILDQDALEPGSSCASWRSIVSLDTW